MIPINRVRTTVLTVLNKENRGWLPPDRFNDIAALSQHDIFNKLIYNEAHFDVSAKSTPQLKASITEMIDVFKRNGRVTQAMTSGDNPTAIANTFNLPSDLYRLDTVRYSFRGKTNNVEIIMSDDLAYMMGTDKTMFTAATPKYIRLGNTIEMYSGQTSISANNVSVYYIKEPTQPLWNYISLGDGSDPIFDSANSVDFELHESLEDELIKRILYYAGVTVREADLTQIIGSSIGNDEQIERS